MAEEKARGSAIVGWLKAGATSACGLVGGAVLMYLTPLVNNAVKPPEPVANFGYQAQGLNVTFQNRSTNATDGWWDFGDGSPLEPFNPKLDTVAHTYAKAAPYSVKLSLTNLFNEKSERTVTVNVDGSSAPAPVIESFTVLPLSPGLTAPAAFRILAKVKNAELLVWTYDGCKKIEVQSSATEGVQERWVTAQEAGCYTFRLVAVGAKQTVEAESKPQWVGVADRTAPTATVSVSYDAVQVERQEKRMYVRLEWPHGNKDAYCAAVGQAVAPPGWRVLKATLDGSGQDPRVKGVPTVEVAPDQGRVLVKAELSRPGGLLGHLTPPPHHVALNMTLEKRSASAPKTMEAVMPLTVPGRTAIPIPALSGNMQSATRQVRLDLAEGDRKIWSGTDLPVNRAMQLKNRPVVLTATMQDGQLVLTVVDPRTGLLPSGQ